MTSSSNCNRSKTKSKLKFLLIPQTTTFFFISGRNRSSKEKSSDAYRRTGRSHGMHGNRWDIVSCVNRLFVSNRSKIDIFEILYIFSLDVDVLKIFERRSEDIGVI